MAREVRLVLIAAGLVAGLGLVSLLLYLNPVEIEDRGVALKAMEPVDVTRVRIVNRHGTMDIRFTGEGYEVDDIPAELVDKLGESGGTKVSSAYQLALKVIRERYNPQLWNVYPIHFSDGDNWGEKDNNLCVELVHKLINMSNLFGYGEIQEGGYRSLSTLMSAFQNIQDEHFIGVTITDRKDVYPALKRFFARREGSEGAREAA